MHISPVSTTARRAAVDVGVPALVLVLLWLPWPSAAAPGALALPAVAAACAVLRGRLPRTASAGCVVATAAAAALGVTSDPMVLAAWTLYPAAVRYGRTVVHPAVAGLGAAVLALLAVATVPGAEDVVRYVLYSGIVLAGSWALGTQARRQRAAADEQAAARAELAALDERARLGREMHDVLTHSLGTIGVRAGVAAHVPTLSEAELRQTLREIEERSRDGLAQLRGVLAATDPVTPGAAPQPGLAELPDLVTGSGADAALELDVRSSVDPAVQLGAYRVVQESLTNVVRHAQGARARVRVVERDGELQVEVADDGPSPAGQGRGLRGIAERARVLGGDARTGPTPEGGFRVSVTLPLHTGENR